MEKQSQKSVMRAVIVSLSVFMALLVVALIINAVRLSAVNARSRELAEKSAELDRMITENQATIDYCQSPEFIEGYAREYLDMIYRGEVKIEVTE